MYFENKKEKNKGVFFIIFLLFFIIVLLLNLTLKNENDIIYTYDATKTVGNTETKVNEYSVEEMIKGATSAVVGISKLEQKGTSIFLNNGISYLGIGSGVIVSEDGYILTNEHVSGEKYSNCYVTLENGKKYNGEVVWSDSNIDLSLIKIDAYKLEYMKLSDSDNIYLGQTVYAIGNPVGFEFQRTVTKGIISGKNRTLKIEDLDNYENSVYMEDLIQTDSTINEGNSGGPLINEEGKIIGINSVKLTSAEGMGFAIPINIVKPILENYFKYDKFDEAYLGIFGYDKEVIPYLEKELELKNGIYVAKISNYGNAQKYIKEGDIILKIDDYELNKMSDLRAYIYTKKPGEITKITVQRSNEKLDFEIELSSKQ